MQYDLVFEGGGAKGMVFVGAMQEFEAGGHTYDRLLGTSAGAITASLLAAGYDSRRMLDALGEQDDRGGPVFAAFLGLPGPFEDADVQASATADFLKSVDIPLVPDSWEEHAAIGIVKGLLRIQKYRHLFSFVEKGGWFSASKFVEWMSAKLDAPVGGHTPGYGAMTLSEFFRATNRELCLIASDTTAQRMLVLNHRTAPACPVVWAVRMSMSIPLVWAEVEWQKEWGRYRGQDMTGHAIVDGGMLSNFPIELLVSDQPQVTAVMGEKKSAHALGFLIDETIEVPGAPPAPPADAGFQWGKLRTGRRLMSLVDTMSAAHDKEVMEAFEQFVVRLPALGYGTMDFAMSPERREALVAAGRSATKEYFRKAAEPGPRTRGLPMPVPEAARREATADRIATRILAR